MTSTSEAWQIWSNYRRCDATGASFAEYESFVLLTHGFLLTWVILWFEFFQSYTWLNLHFFFLFLLLWFLTSIYFRIRFRLTLARSVFCYEDEHLSRRSLLLRCFCFMQGSRRCQSGDKMFRYEIERWRDEQVEIRKITNWLFLIWMIIFLYHVVLFFYHKSRRIWSSSSFSDAEQMNFNMKKINDHLK